jgi:hypothetical protein
MKAAQVVFHGNLRGLTTNERALVVGIMGKCATADIGMLEAVMTQITG